MRRYENNYDMSTEYYKRTWNKECKACIHFLSWNWFSFSFSLLSLPVCLFLFHTLSIIHTLVLHNGLLSVSTLSEIRTSLTGAGKPQRKRNLKTGWKYNVYNLQVKQIFTCNKDSVPWGCYLLIDGSLHKICFSLGVACFVNYAHSLFDEGLGRVSVSLSGTWTWS